MRLTGTGIWSGHLRYGDAGLIAEAAAELDELGYSAIWIPDVGGDVLGSVEHLLRPAPRIAVATGILNIWMHDPAEVAQQRASWSGRLAAALRARPRRQPRAADRPRQSGSLPEAVLEDGRVPRRARRGSATGAGRCAGPRRAAAADARPRPRSRRGRAPVFRARRTRRRGARACSVPSAMIGVELAVVLDRDPVDRARDRAPAHRGLREPAELHEQPARLRFRRRRLRRRGQRPARRRDRRVGRPRHHRAARARRCATRAPTTCASR